jgi:hypothetical protein
MRKWFLLLLLAAARVTAAPDALLHTDDFSRGLNQWVIEQQPGGTVAAATGRLVIDDTGGCTVWLRARLTAPVRITYTARISSAGRISDLNCFWMASDPAQPDDLFAPGRGRDGKFARYDTLRTYYVGYGGNNNTTTRFRRFDGTGARPLLPQHDLSAPKFLLQADHAYRIALVAGADGRVQFIRDGEVVFNWTDPQPLRRGWFGFRTVNSRITISDFQVQAGVPAGVDGR